MSIECAFFGVLGRDAENKVSGSGKNYLRLNVRTGDGDAAQWLNVMCFDADAIAVVDKMVKGARVYVEGKLSLDEWTAQDGSKRHGLSAVSWHCHLSQIGRNKQPRQDKPTSGQIAASRNMHAPLGSGTAGLNDDIPYAPEVR
ncbi:single-stranded DNA-binding protein [Bradyrhizobium diazoefficiens]